MKPIRSRFVSKNLHLLADKLYLIARRLENNALSPIRDCRQTGMPIVIVNSVPKCGTHLLGKLCGLIGYYNLPIMLLHNSYIDYEKQGDWDRWQPIRDSGITDFGNPSRLHEKTEISLRRLLPGQSVISHLPYRASIRKRLQEQKIRHLFIIRDLRDALISYVDYMTNLRGHAHNPGYYFYQNRLKADEERIMTGLLGLDRFVKPFSYHVELAIPWIQEPDILVVRFEDLIGTLGGGSAEAQLNTLDTICRFLGVSFPEEELIVIADKLWGGTLTMNRGKCKSWQARFTPKIQTAFETHYSGFMSTLGYQ